MAWSRSSTDSTDSPLVFEYRTDTTHSIPTGSTWIDSPTGQSHVYDGRYHAKVVPGKKEYTHRVNVDNAEIALLLNIAGLTSEKRIEYIELIFRYSKDIFQLLDNAWYQKETVGDKLDILSDLISMLSVFDLFIRNKYWEYVVSSLEQYFPLADKVLPLTIDGVTKYISITGTLLKNSRVSFSSDKNVMTAPGFSLQERPHIPGRDTGNNMDELPTNYLLQTGAITFIESNRVSREDRKRIIQGPAHGSNRILTYHGFASRVFIPYENTYLALQYTLIGHAHMNGDCISLLYDVVGRNLCRIPYGRIYSAKYRPKEIEELELSVALTLPHVFTVEYYLRSNTLPHSNAPKVYDIYGGSARSLVGII